VDHVAEARQEPRQLGRRDPEIGLLDVAGFYAPLRAMVAQAQQAGFVDAIHIDRLQVDDDPERLLASLYKEAAARGGREDFSPV